jgi:adenylate cyclase
LSTYESIDQLALAIIWAAVLLLVLRSKSISSRTLSLISICGAGLILGLCLSSFLIQGFVVAYPIHLLVWVVGSALAYFYKAYSEEKLRRRVQGSFAQYISPEVVKRIAQSKQMPALGGERIQATVVFIDVRGFTGLTEHLKDEPELLVSVVSEVMSEITSHLIQEGATIDKYIGDCVMAFWNAPERQQDHLLKAMRATIGLVRDSDRIAAKVRQMNSRLTAIPIQFGVGLSTGEVIVGNLGSHFRFNYSVLGDVVNLASRLESLTKEMQEPILVAGVDSVSLSLLAANDIYLESKGLVEIRGRQSRVEVFRPNLEYRPTEA